MASPTPVIFARKVWQTLPAPLRRRLWSSYARRKAWALYCARTLPTPAIGPVEGPLVIAGLFSTANGLGAAARATYQSLVSVGLDPIAVDLSHHFAPVDMTPDMKLEAFPAARQGTLIVQLNAPEVTYALHYLGLNKDRSWRQIGYWAWELPVFPTGWETALPFMSDIWAVSDFTAKALSNHPQTGPIHCVPHAIETPSGITPNKNQFGIAPEAFTFLLMADSKSSLARKNPGDAITAFKQAFGDDPLVQLVVKTRNLASDPLAQKHLQNQIGPASNISILDESLSHTDQWSLMASVDAFVSLHRSEGFGLPIAEAMILGKPVIATDWSGNTDFFNASCGLPVAATLIPCDDPYHVYTQINAEWAQPDIAQAAEYMKRLVVDPNLGAALGSAARKQITQNYTPQRIGEQMKQLLYPL